MAKIKATVKDANTLALIQDGKIGDTIDLRDLQEADFNHVSETLQRSMDKRVEERFEKAEAQMIAENDNKLKAALLQNEKEVEEKNREEKMNLQRENDKLRNEMQNAKQLFERDFLAEKDKSNRVIENMENKYKLDLNEKLAAAGNETSAQVRHLEQALKEARDFNIRSNVKMIGESLEQHCEYEFVQIQGLLSEIADVEFYKDTKAVKGEEVDEDKATKGDYIYRERDKNGLEVLTILFEMKNEGVGTKQKQKNADCFDRLHKNRNKKGCEYAVLVSALEKESPIYGEIFAVPSKQYPNMYVIRPQAFRTIIELLRKAANKSVAAKLEIAFIERRERGLYRD